MLRRHMNETEVIDMVAHSSEIENIVVRDEEQNELEMLVRSSCPLEVKVIYIAPLKAIVRPPLVPSH
ncbi:unnamed protein product [Prunus armeniaca]|uniref:SEC63 domain-containing protein n=1 Tax=Prunus armeniaca TaxID=36596 RepID=A0A6J5X247_PRUAR|nr:unnamed protein product [Prunus armeniaca]